MSAKTPTHGFSHEFNADPVSPKLQDVSLGVMREAVWVG
jgi:hypothetical protein